MDDLEPENRRTVSSGSGRLLFFFPVATSQSSPAASCYPSLKLVMRRKSDSRTSNDKNIFTFWRQSTGMPPSSAKQKTVASTAGNPVFLTHEAIKQAIEGFSDQDLARLKARARKFMAFSRDAGDWQDLLQEAFMRAIDGRNCSGNMPVYVFLVLIMRSIASHWRKRAHVGSRAGSTDVQVHAATIAVSTGASPERRAIATLDSKLLIGKLEKSIGQDQELLAILGWLREGLSFADMRAVWTSRASIDTAKRRFQRKAIAVWMRTQGYGLHD